jgi:hypothetical protein
MKVNAYTPLPAPHAVPRNFLGSVDSFANLLPQTVGSLSKCHGDTVYSVPDYDALWYSVCERKQSRSAR